MLGKSGGSPPRESCANDIIGQILEGVFIMGPNGRLANTMKPLWCQESMFSIAALVIDPGFSPHDPISFLVRTTLESAVSQVPIETQSTPG